MVASGRTTFEPNQAFFDRVLLTSGVKALQLSVGRGVLATAKANAPVDTADYKNKLRPRWVRRRYRDALLIEGTDPKTLLIESKTGNLARALKGGSR